MMAALRSLFMSAWSRPRGFVIAVGAGVGWAGANREESMSQSAIIRFDRDGPAAAAAEAAE